MTEITFLIDSEFDGSLLAALILLLIHLLRFLIAFVKAMLITF